MIRTRAGVRFAESTLIAILVLEGVLALAGGVMLVAAPSGRSLGMPTAWLEATPFSSFLVPGLLLATALGLLPLFAAVALWRPRATPRLQRVERALGMDTAWLATVAAGAAMMIWIVTQIAMVRMFHPMQAFIFALGALVVASSLLPSVRAAHVRPGVRASPQRERSTGPRPPR